MAPRALREQVPALSAQRESDDSGSPPLSAPWSDDALDDDEEGEWTPVFPKKWGQKKNDSTVGREEEAVMKAAAQLVALSTVGITGVESGKGNTSAAVAEGQHVAEVTAVADDQHAAESTAIIEKKEHIAVPVVGKNHKRNQKRKNKKKGMAEKLVEHLAEGAASDDPKNEVSSTQVEDATGDVREAKTSPSQAGDTYNDVALFDASPDGVATAELCSEPALISMRDAKTSPAQVDDIIGDIAQFDASSDEITTPETDSEPACISDGDDTIIVEPQKTLRADSMMGDMSFNAETSEMFEADQTKELCATTDDDGVFLSIEETVVLDNKEGRNARRNKKRSQAKKSKKAAKGSMAVVSRLSITEGHKWIVAFLAGVVFGALLTYVLRFWVHG